MNIQLENDNDIHTFVYLTTLMRVVSRKNRQNSAACGFWSYIALDFELPLSFLAIRIADNPLCWRIRGFSPHCRLTGPYLEYWEEHEQKRTEHTRTNPHEEVIETCSISSIHSQENGTLGINYQCYGVAGEERKCVKKSGNGFLNTLNLYVLYHKFWGETASLSEKYINYLVEIS